MQLLLAAFAAACITISAQAQTPPVRVVGTIANLDGNALSLTAPDGQTVAVTLSPSARVYGVEKRTLGDLKPGDYLASGGVKGVDGKIHASEVRIFPESLRGLGEGQRPWSIKSEGVMTNATIGTVSQSEQGSIVHVTYKGGESDLSVAADVPVLAYVDDTRGLLKPGAAVLIFAQKQGDGSLTADRVTAEKNGVKPPM